MPRTLARVLDRQTLGLAGLLVSVQTLALAVAMATVANQDRPTLPAGASDSAAGQAGAAAAWTGIEIVIAGALVVVAYLYGSAPDWLRRAARRVALLGVGVYVGLAASPTAAAVIVAGYAVVQLANHVDVYWLINDALAIVLATAIAVGVGLLFGVPGMVIALVGLSLYDRFFADKTDWMFDMLGVAVGARLPVLVVVPSGWRFPWASLQSGELEDDAFAIGTADLALPAAFGVAVATTPYGWLPSADGAGVAVMIGLLVGAVRLTTKMREQGAGAGLPPLTASVLGSYGVAVVLTAAAALV